MKAPAHPFYKVVNKSALMVSSLRLHKKLRSKSISRKKLDCPHETKRKHSVPHKVGTVWWPLNRRANGRRDYRLITLRFCSDQRGNVTQGRVDRTCIDRDSMLLSKSRTPHFLRMQNPIFRINTGTDS